MRTPLARCRTFPNWCWSQIVTHVCCISSQTFLKRLQHERGRNEAGVELNFATNVLGCYLLTKGLAPALAATAAANASGGDAHESRFTPRVVMVSSAGMLTEKLDPSDLQLDRWRKFDGTRAYSLNKRAQVLLAERWAKDQAVGGIATPGVFYSSMHPGWSDTEAVKTALPDFYERQQSTLRSPEQGADTALWLAAANDVDTDNTNGEFFEDRAVTRKHLWGCWTQSSTEDVDSLLSQCEALLTAT